ncbi:uncharacterized protein LOC128988512 isoform X2 [Macrosteles quadrilineatus]|uniref:uncharacterized protein LOC128988512 isoform X2 n=1 Tax=Macrosteles quadrilineatus TaxID=74068 RepID=UPI0023E0BABE|nr:uncharacterized protein LOC128988512 isoform X2 [Macrosteles quadrilineatus]
MGQIYLKYVDGVSSASKTFTEVLRESRLLGNALLQLGVSKGDTLAISCENRLEFSVVMLASLLKGFIFAPLNPSYSKDEIVHVLNISKPKIIFCSGYTFANVSSSVSQLQDIKHIVLFDKANSTLPSYPIPVILFNILLINSPSLADISPGPRPEDGDVATILTSSGTTGLPKGVMLSFGNLKYFYNSSVSTFLSWKPDDVVLGLIPLYHGYGFGMLLCSFLFGAKMVLLPKFQEELFLSTIRKFKVTSLSLVPPLMTFLAKHPLVPQYDLSSVREVVCGAAPLSVETIHQVKARLPRADFRQGYGMTELSIVISITPPHSTKLDSVGKLAPGLQAKILDVETGKCVARGQPGEIVVRGPAVMVGYCNDPTATRLTIDSDGWLHTGDVGYVDDEGFFYIIDRIKELIKYNGYQVAPAELESLLMGLTGVRDAAVIGLPDVTCGELPLAFVVLQPNAALTESDIIGFVKGKVSPQKRLRVVRFVQSIPRSPSGKILRRMLKQSLTSKL